MRADGALVGAEQPPLQERRDPMDARHRYVSGIARRVEAVPVVEVAEFGERVVAGVAVGRHDAAELDQLLDHRQQAVGAGIDDRRKANATHTAAALLDRDQHRRLLLGSTAVFAGCDAADVGLVNLDLASEPIAAGPDHRASELMQQRPGRLVAPEAEHTLERERAHPVLRAGRIPGRRKPGHKRQPRVGEDRPRRCRGAPVAGRAAQQTIAHPPARNATAGRADEAAHPAQPREIVEANGKRSESRAGRRAAPRAA
jgi:hypothetical protein